MKNIVLAIGLAITLIASVDASFAAGGAPSGGGGYSGGGRSYSGGGSYSTTGGYYGGGYHGGYYGGGYHGGYYGGGYHGGYYGGTRVYIGGGWGWPGWGWGWPGWYGAGWWGAPYPYYSYPYPYSYGAPVAVQQAPTEYIQQQPAPQYWYYCQNPQGYYPYVKDCSMAWIPVSPQPPQIPQGGGPPSGAREN